MNGSRLLSCAVLAGMLIITGCNVFGGGGNEAPVISEIFVEPPNPRVNTEVTLTAEASDPDGDELSYEWEAEVGSFTDPSDANPTQWIAPPDTGRYEVTCTVSDGELNVSRTTTIEVEVPSQ